MHSKFRGCSEEANCISQVAFSWKSLPATVGFETLVSPLPAILAFSFANNAALPCHYTRHKGIKGGGGESCDSKGPVFNTTDDTVATLIIGPIPITTFWPVNITVL